MSNLENSRKQLLRPSGVYTPEVIEAIQAKADLGRYRIRGFRVIYVHCRKRIRIYTRLPED